MESSLFFDFNQKSSILLIFFFNAIVFSGLIFRQGIKSGTKRDLWLAGFILLGGLYICPFMLGYAGWYSIKSYREFMFFMPFQHLFLLGPVFFFYLKALLGQDRGPRQIELIHFVPSICYLVYSIIVFITDKFIFDEFYFYADGKDKDLDVWYQVAGLISMLYYFFRSMNYYHRYRKVSVQEVSFADEVAFRWIEHFMVMFSLMLVLRVLFFILNPEWWEFGRKFWYYLCFSVLLMFISIKGYSNIIKTNFRIAPTFLSKIDDLESSVQENNEDIAKEKWVLNQLGQRINIFFNEEKIHKNPNLTLTDLANLIQTNRNMVSKAINQQFKLNFNDFVNQKRISEVIEKLHSGEHHKTTLLGIAFDSGFNSKATFNRAFKKSVGMTPQQYITNNQL